MRGRALSHRPRPCPLSTHIPGNLSVIPLHAVIRYTIRETSSGKLSFTHRRVPTVSSNFRGRRNRWNFCREGHGECLLISSDDEGTPVRCE